MLSLIWVSLGIPLHARILYVAQSEGASDENDGSSAAPFRTILAAINAARVDDFVIVRQGDYRDDDVGWGPGTVPVLKSATQQAPIRIFAARGARPKVRKFLMQNARNIRIQGFDLEDYDFASQPDWQDMPAIVREPQSQMPLDYSQPWSTRENRVRAEFATYFAISETLEYESAFDLEGCRNIEIVDNQIGGYWAGINCRDCFGIKINQNQISHCVNGIYTFRPAPALRHSEIRGNFITQCLDNGIDIREKSHNVTITDNALAFNGRSHISLIERTRDILVAQNSCSHGGYYSETMEFPGSSGISVHSSLGGIVLKQNTVHYQVDLTGIDGNGLAIDLMLQKQPVIVQSNTVYRSMGDGLTITASPNNLIRNNMFFESGHNALAYRRGGGIKLSRTQDIGNTVVNNVFAFNRAGGILSENTIAKQHYVDRNEYYLNAEPIIWDGYLEGEKQYFGMMEARFSTAWENNGMAYGPLAW